MRYLCCTYPHHHPRCGVPNPWVITTCIIYVKQCYVHIKKKITLFRDISDDIATLIWGANYPWEEVGRGCFLVVAKTPATSPSTRFTKLQLLATFYIQYTGSRSKTTRWSSDTLTTNTCHAISLRPSMAHCLELVPSSYRWSRQSLTVLQSSSYYAK